MPKIVRLHEVGGPEKLSIEEQSSQQPGKGEIKLRVQAVGLNRAETLFMRGLYFEKPALPSRIGVEAAGVIEAVGADVDPGLIGKAVATVGGFPQSRYGVLGEEALVPANAVAEYGLNLSPTESAAVWISYLTAWGALVHVACVEAGEVVVITAGSSSVGLSAIQIVKRVGAISVVTTRSMEKRQELLALGADHVIVTEEEDLPARVRDITGGYGVRTVFDSVGGPSIDSLAEAVAPGGTILLYGALDGRPTIYPLATGFAKGISLRGYSMNEIRSKPAVLEAGLRSIREGLRDGRLAPKIARTFPLAQVADAYRYLESNNQIGKVVITI